MSIRSFLLFLAIAGISSVVFTVAPFAWNLRDISISTTSPELWAHFGTYIGGILGPVFAFLNLVVVAYIAVRVTELQQTGLASKRLTLDLYNEWHSQDLHKSRINMTAVVEWYARSNAPLPTLSEFERNGGDNEVHAFRIYHFFEKWAHLAHEHQIDSPLLSEMLTTYVNWWKTAFFAPLIARENDPFVVGTLRLIEREVLSKIKAQVAQAGDAQPGGQPDLAQEAAQGRLP